MDIKDWFKEFYRHNKPILIAHFLVATLGVYAFEVFHGWKPLVFVGLIIWLFASVFYCFKFDEQSKKTRFIFPSDLIATFVNIGVVVAVEFGGCLDEPTLLIKRCLH